MKFYKLLILSCISLFLLSCGSSDDETEILFDAAMANAVTEVVLRINKEAFDTNDSNRLDSMGEGDPFVINNAKREGDFIQIEVSYSGGCKKHTFEIIWDGIVYTDDPCHMNLQVIHRGNNDSCEAFITETILVNLEELIGDVTYKNDCAYNIFSTYNSGELPDAVILGL